MSEVKELKELVGKEEMNLVKGLLNPYKKLSDYIVQLENKINSLQDNVEPKPKATRRRATKPTEE